MGGQELERNSPFDGRSIAYHRGAFRPLEECQVNIMTHALQYGTMVFGGVRGYHDADTNRVFIFRLSDHVARLQASARIMQMKPPVDAGQMSEIILELVRRNGYRANVYFRPFIYKSALQLSPRLHDVPDDFSVYSLRLDDYLDTQSGLRTVISSWRRIDENIIPTRAKVSGGYANSVLAKSEAVQHGFDEAIFLDARGFVSEGSAENIFMVRGGTLITPPVTASVLEGITRRSIIEIARDENIPVVERDIARAELYIADELFFTGTGAQVAWIAEVDRRPVADGKIGPITRRLQDIFMDVVRGRSARYRHWLAAPYAD